jgi:hypothetical protein
MTQAIATVGSVAGNIVGDIHRPPLPGETQPRPAPTPEARMSTLSLPETRAAARQIAEAQGRYQVHIHAETMRIITEVVDMTTGDVVMYFPPGYRPNAKPPASSADKEPAEAGK